MVRMNLKWAKLKKFNHIFFKEKAKVNSLSVTMTLINDVPNFPFH